MRLPQAQLLPLLASCRCDGCRAVRAAKGEPEPPPPVDAKAARAAAAAAKDAAAADGDDPHIGDGVWLVDHIKDRRVVDGGPPRPPRARRHVKDIGGRRRHAVGCRAVRNYSH